MGPLVAPADSDVLSVQRLDALNSSFHRGYMQQKQQAEANAKLPLIQAESKVGIAKAKEELEDMQDPDRALVRQKTRELGLKTLVAGNRKLDEDTQMAAQDFAKRQAMAIFEIGEIERNKWRVNDMADFLSKQGVNYDWNPNDPPEAAAQKLKGTIADYRKFLQWTASAKARLDKIKTTTQTKTVAGKDGAKKEYQEVVSYDASGFVPQDEVKELELAQLMTFEQFQAYSKVFQKFAQPAQDAAEPPQSPTTSGYQPNVPLTPPMTTAPPPQETTDATPTEDSPDVSRAMLTAVVPAVRGRVPAETQRTMAALLEAPGMLRQMKRSYDQNRESGTEVIKFPMFTNEDGSPVTLDMAPIIGWMKNKNPWDPKAQALKQSVRAAVSTFARGIFREVGVLSDADIQRYVEMLPGTATPEAAAKMLFAILEETLDRSALMSAALNYDTVEGQKIAEAFGYSKEDIDSAITENAGAIAAGREERNKLLGKDKTAAATPEAAAASFVKQYGVQPPPPGLGLAPHPDNPGTLIYVDMNTGEWFPARKAQ